MNLYLQLGSNNFHEIRYNDRLNSSPIIGPSSDYEGYEQDVIDVKTAISTVPFVHNLAFAIPVAGTPVPYNVRRKAGSYLLGQRRATCPVKCMYICCARREKTHKFYTIKVLSLQDEGIDTITQDDIQGMFLMHNEYILLNRLAETSGVYNVHAYFRDLYAEEEMNENSILVYTGRVKVRLCLVLDFVAPNDTYPICELENLQQYVVEKKVLTEREAITIFREILLIVKILHDKNIVHRDIKLGNMMLHRKTLKVTLINFGLGRSLSKENVLLSDQRGSPAYISPDVLSGTPYAPKPSDMWSLGVSLYIMLMGCFPFYDVNVNQLFNKVIRGSYIIPLLGIDSMKTVDLLKGLLIYNPEMRLNVDGAINLISSIIDNLKDKSDELMQEVPDLKSEEISSEMSFEYRWKFAVLQKDNKIVLRKCAGQQVPILHLTPDEKRVKAIEMKYIKKTEVKLMPDILIKNAPISSGIFNGKPVISKIEPPNIIDQVVPKIDSEESDKSLPNRKKIAEAIGVVIIPPPIKKRALE